MKKFISLLILALCLSLNLSLAQSLSVGQQEKIEALVSQFMRNSKVPGMAISIAKNNQLAFSKGYGWADVEQQVAVNPAQTKFRIASISKTLTADAIMQLVEAGKLDLDAPVQRYIPTFPEKRWLLTTRLVAGHLGGIRHYRGQEFLSTTFYANVSQGLKIFQDDSLLYEPGSKYSYSSYGFNLISAVIERATGMDYLTYMQANVFDKLAMLNTVPDNNSRVIAHRGRYYQIVDNDIENAIYVDNSYKWAGGGFLSTSEDLIKFAGAHAKPGYLTSSSLQTLVTSQKTTDGTETNYGLGWTTTIDKQGHHWVGHSGGAIGGTSKMVVYPEEGIIIIVLTNLSNAGLGDFPHQLGWLLMK